jgi:hypothetical protein
MKHVVSIPVAILWFSIVSIGPGLCPARAAEPEFFKVPPIEAFDGKSWGGLTIGESTTDAIKMALKTSKGAVRPEAMLLPQPEHAPVRIDVLMHGRGGGSILSGFRIGYEDEAPTEADLAARLKQDPEIWFPRMRYDEWHIAAFPARGVVAFVDGMGASARASVILLCSPSRVRFAIENCVNMPMPIGDVHDAFPDEQRVLNIGIVSVDIGTVKGLTLRDKSDAEREIVKRIRRLRTPRQIDLVDGAAGTLKATVSINCKEKKAKVEVHTDLSGRTPLGAVSTAADGSDTVTVDQDNPTWSDSRHLEETVFDTVDRVYRQAAGKIVAQRLPTPAQMRATATLVRINLATP